MDDYIICIPSYNRSNICNEKTLNTLNKNNIDSHKIYVYVANKEEYDIYKSTLNTSFYNKLIIGKKGIVQQRQFINEQWPENKHIVFLDDDIESIDRSLSPKFKNRNLDYFIKEAFKECEKNNSFIWGVYAVFNPFFRKDTPEISTDLKFIVGAFYAIINRPNLKNIQLTLSVESGQKDDVERTIKYFINDGIVIRFNRIGFKTKYFGKEGGLGRFEERLKPNLEVTKKLEETYPEYGYIKFRKNGMAEFVLRKNPINNTQKQPKIQNTQNTQKRKKLNNKRTIKLL